MGIVTKWMACVLLATAACSSGPLSGAAADASDLTDRGSLSGDDTADASPAGDEGGPASSDAAPQGVDASDAADAPVGPISISPIAYASFVQNTLAQAPVHETFTVSDPAGLDGLVVTGTTDAPLATQVLVSCLGGECTVDFTFQPLDAGVYTVTMRAQDDHGVATGTFSLDIAPRLVTSGADHGVGTLRAIAGTSDAGDVIAFDPTVTTVRLTDAVVIATPLTIEGPGAEALTIDATGAAVAFDTTGDPVTISGLTLSNASVGIEVDAGTLRLITSVISHNAIEGLDVFANTGAPATAQVEQTMFLDNGTYDAIVETDDGAAHLDAAVCTFEGATYGIAVEAAGAGNTATIALTEGNVVRDDTGAGVLVEGIHGGRASASIVAAPGDPNLVTNSAIGVQRGQDSAGESDVLTITPASQVTGNTTDFDPKWP
jgi:hypothetical protein